VNTLQEVRVGVRLLAKRRAYTALAVGTLAVGIAAATAISGVLTVLLVRPLPYTDSERIVQVVTHRMDGRVPVRSPSMALPYFTALRERARSLMAVGAYDSFSNVTRRRLAMAVDGREGVIELLGTRISPSLLSMLGVAPAVGRSFESTEERPDHNDVIILSDRAWRTEFGADAGILGRRLRIDARAYTVVGVMPQGFDFPDRQTDFWIPLTPAPVPPPSAPRSDSPDSAYEDGVFGRLRAGVSVQAAASEVEALLRQVDQELAVQRGRPTGFPASMPKRADVVSMKEELVAPARPLLRVLSFAAMCVLLIACANVVNLLLMGTASKYREMATRLALGASRLQLVRPVLIESLLLSIGAAVLGVPLTYWLLRAVTHLAPADLPRMQEVGVSVPLLGGAVALSLLIGLATGLVPAWRVATRSDRLERTLHGRPSAQAVSTVLSVGGRRLLVKAEIALAVMLLAAAGLLVRSFASLTHVDVGFDARAVTTFQVIAPPGSETSRGELYGDVLRRLANLPGVEAAGATDVLPLAGASGYRFALAGLPVDPGPGDPMVMRLVTPDYFRAMGIRIVAGQSFADGAASRRQVLVNEEMARRYFVTDRPVGAIVGQGADTYEVVGVVADVRHDGFRGRVQPEYYLDLRRSGLAASIRPFFVVKSQRTTAELVPEVRALIREVHPQAGIGVNSAAMATIVSDSVSAPRFNMVLLTALAAVAVVLAAIAVFGVTSHAVSRRLREIGVRIALGADRRDVIALVLRQAGATTGTGILIGLVGALALTRSMQAILFGITPFDPTTFVAAPLSFAVVALLAVYVPVRRALKVDPSSILREE
jgi:putative ABC transport system permease protein